MKTAADCLRQILEKLDAGEDPEDWGPFVVLLGKAMMRKKVKP